MELHWRLQPQAWWPEILALKKVLFILNFSQFREYYSNIVRIESSFST